MQFKTGTVTGTGAQIDVSLGFVPACVLMVNETDGTRVDIYLLGQTLGTSVKVTGSGAATAANGIGPFAGTSLTASPGFSIGATASTSGKTLRYIALGENGN